MRHLVLLLLLLAFRASGNDQWFPPADMMTIGVYYYPEAWPEAQWSRDMSNIKKLGMEYVHMGEFAWYFMEPEEGKYQFEWLEKNVQLARQQGLKVILCTPTPTPPIWLVRRHPEVLMVDDAGRRMNHGSREHADWSSPVYRDYAQKIIAELGKRFGDNPAVWGWQLDNELSHYGKLSYSDSARSRFRAWLRQRYETIDKLNRDWGNAFWSQMYQSFDQIDIPNAREAVQAINPHAQLDFQRFFAEEAADYLRMQAETLRKYVKNQWITTNYMAMYKDVDPTRSAKDLDVYTWTHYPVHGNLNYGPLGFRLGNAPVMSFMHDWMRPINGYSGLMELQPGQVNWGESNPWPLPGAIRMWILRAFAQGAKLVCTYRYRQPLFGSELYHKGLVETDGVTPSPGGREYAQAMKEVAELRKKRPERPVEPTVYASRRTGFLVSYDNWWDVENHKQTDRWDTTGHWMKYYRAVKTMMAPVDVITESAALAKYPFLMALAYQMLDEALVTRLREYVENGGRLVLSCRTGHKDRRGQLWEGAWAAPILDLIGASIPFYDVLPNPVRGKVSSGQPPVAHEWAAWGEILEPNKGTTTLATYGDQFYQGRPAAVTRKLGKGSVTYIGVESLSGDLERALLFKVYTDAGVNPARLDYDFLVDWRDGFWVATNFTEKKQTLPVPARTPLLLGSRVLDPAGVAVWTE